MQNKLFLFPLFLLFSACSIIKQSPDMIEYDSEGVVEAPRIKDGKCYQKAMIPDQYKYEDTEFKYPIYTGEGEPEGVRSKTVVITPPTTKWVKKTDKNCGSADPNDCLVWCLVEVPGEEKTYLIVTDTTKIKKFDMRPISKKVLTKEGGITEWVEVLCNEAENPDLYYEISIALKSRGYLETPQNKKDNKLKAALTQFQKDKGFPVGHFNLLTLKALGINQ